MDLQPEGQAEAKESAHAAEESRPDRAYTPPPAFAKPGAGEPKVGAVLAATAAAVSLVIAAAYPLYHMASLHLSSTQAAYAPLNVEPARVERPATAVLASVVAVSAPPASSPLPLAAAPPDASVAQAALEKAEGPMSTDDMIPLAARPAEASAPAPTSPAPIPPIVKHLSGNGPKLPAPSPSGFRLLYAAQGNPRASSLGEERSRAAAVSNLAGMQTAVRVAAVRAYATAGANVAARALARPRETAAPRALGADNPFTGIVSRNLAGQSVALDALPSSRNLVVYVVPWCGWCHKNTQIIRGLGAELGSGTPTRVIVGDAKDEDVRDYAGEFGPGTVLDGAHKADIHGFPTYLITDEHGNVLKRRYGAFASMDEALAWAR